MNILLLTDQLDAGGAETHLLALARGLVRRGDRVEVISSGGKTAERLARAGIPHHSMKLCTHNPLRLLRLRRRLRRLIREGQFDVVHAHARIPALLLRGRKIGNCVRFVTIHAHYRATPLLRRLCYWGDRTVAVSEDLRTYLADAFGVPAERVEVIPNGVDTDEFAPRMQKSSAIRLLFASRLDADCALGAELLCRIAPLLCRRYPDLEIGIAGGGGELDRIRILAEGLNRRLGGERIRLYGHVEDMPALLAAQDIFVGVSRAALEASACGAAVILCGNEGYLGILSPELLDEASLSNLCCRGAAGARAFRLECDIRFLCEHPDERHRIADEVREQVLSRFSANSMVEQTRNAYCNALPRPSDTRLLIGGYFGCGNAGDDAILEGFLRGIETIAPHCSVQALAASPMHAERRFGIRCVERKNPIAIRHALRSCDVFLCGGGSLLQNTTSRRTLLYYLSLLRMAKRAGCRVVLYAAGIGPIHGRRAKKQTARALALCDYLSVRDPQSLRALRDLGVDPARLHEGADPALLLPSPPPARALSLRIAHGLAPRAPLLCLVLRRPPRHALHLWKILAISASILCRRHNLTPVLLFFSEEDAAFGDRLRSLLDAPIVSARDTSERIAWLQGAQIILSMRLHALVLATLTATPAIGIATDPDDDKIPAFARLSGQPVLQKSLPSVGEIVALSEQMLASRDSVACVLEGACNDLQKKARKDLANIAQMLYNKGDTDRIGI